MAITSTTRLLGSTRPVKLNFGSNGSCSSLGCLNKGKASGGWNKGFDMKSKGVAVKAMLMAPEVVVSTTESFTKSAGVYLSSVVSDVANVALKIWEPVVRRRSWNREVQMLIEKGIIDCRFFALLAVAGTLLGSVLCFVEGCFLIVESYFEYFKTISNKSSDEGHLVHLLIEAIDMFLVGSAMLIFGVGVYTMFVGARNFKRENGGMYGSNFFGLFHLKMLPEWVEVPCVSQAKSKIGHALLMILQVGVVDKFKNVPLVTGFDLACFAGSVLISSACIFLLSKLSPGRNEG